MKTVFGNIGELLRRSTTSIFAIPRDREVYYHLVFSEVSCRRILAKDKDTFEAVLEQSFRKGFCLLLGQLEALEPQTYLR